MSPDAINSVPAGASSAPQEPIRHLLNAEQRAKCRILLAEDNPVNQNLASRLLRKAGFQCDIANNGDEALKALTQEKYDLVLMDCHMPVMDGYAAAARIRRGEKSEASHLKIIAMTAEGAHGERQRCLAAGMDDHISKPFEMRALYEVIEKHLAGKNIFPPSEVPVPRSPSGPAASFNLTRLNEMTEGDREFERELLQQYAADTARHLTTISLEIERNNAEQVRREVHTVKGSSANVGAEQLAKLAQEMESRAAAADLQEARRNLTRLEAEFDTVKKFIAERVGTVQG